MKKSCGTCLLSSFGRWLRSTLLKRTLYHLDFTNSSSSASTLFNPALPGYSTQTDVSVKTSQSSLSVSLGNFSFVKLISQTTISTWDYKYLGKLIFSIWTISTWKGFFFSPLFSILLLILVLKMELRLNSQTRK